MNDFICAAFDAADYLLKQTNSRTSLMHIATHAALENKLLNSSTGGALREFYVCRARQMAFYVNNPFYAGTANAATETGIPTQSPVFASTHPTQYGTH